MKKTTILKTLLFACSAGLLASCSDDKYDGAAPEEITANYDNIPNAGMAHNLTLTYSGDTLFGKSVKFITSDSKKADIVLENILPHEANVTISNVNLQSDGKGGYDFNGNGATSPLNTQISYNGNVSKGQLKLNLDVTVPDNFLAQQGTWNVYKATTFSASGNGQGIIVTMGGAQPTDFGPMVGALAGNFIGSVLRDVTFNKDGNITATYASVPSDIVSQIGTLMTGNIPRNDDEWKQSPKNLATYYLAEDSSLYVTPNVYMILNQIAKDNETNDTAGTAGASLKASRAAGIGDLQNTIKTYIDVYDALMTWGTTGLKLKVEKSDKTGASADDIMLTVTGNELKPLFKLLKNLPQAARNYEIAAGMKLGTILDMLEFSDNFRMSLYFTKATK